MTIYNVLFHFFVVGVLLVSKTASSATFRYDISPQTIQPGERVRLTVRVEGATFEPVIQEDLLVESTHLTLLDRNQELENGVLTLHYDVTAYNSGPLTVPPIQIQVGPDTFSTEASSITIQSNRPEDDEALRPEYDKLSLPWPWKHIIIALLVATTTFALSFLYRKLKSRRRPAAQSIPIPLRIDEDPLEWLKREIIRIRRDIQTGEEISPVDEFSHTLKAFYERQLRTPVTAWTTLEFERHLATDPSARGIHRLFIRCDLYKYLPKKLEDAKELALDCLENAESILVKPTYVHSA